MKSEWKMSLERKMMKIKKRGRTGCSTRARRTHKIPPKQVVPKQSSMVEKKGVLLMTSTINLTMIKIVKKKIY